MQRNTDEQGYKDTKRDKRGELVLANKELAFQNEEKDKRANELILANEEKDKRADELILANQEKDKRADELILANEEKDKRADELILANEEKEKRADELALANKELEKRADELVLANKELAFQNEEKDKRADELILANEEKEKRADELALANEEKEKRAIELVLANKEKEKHADELVLANKELAFQTELDGYRSEMERVAQDLTILIDTANAPIFGIDAHGKVNEWNQQAQKITGYTKDEVMGRDLVTDFITDDYKASVGEVLAKALKGEETANFEFPLFTKSGDRVDVLLNSTTRRDASGQTVGMVGVGQDITKLNKVLVEQERISNDLTRLIDTANAPIFGIDADGKVNEWNQRAEKITGYNKKEVMGRDLVADFITDDYKASVGEVLEKALKGEETANFEFPLFTKSGDRVDVLLNSTTRRDASGQTVGMVGVGQDITELNKVLVEQARISNDLTRLIDTANAPIFGIDADGKVNEWNQQAEKITGFNKEEVMGRSLVSDFITDDYKASVGEVLEKALKGKETANYEFPLFTKSGDRVDVLLNSTTRRDTSGQIVGVVGVGQNITELNKVRVEQETERKLSAAQIIQSSKLATLGEMATSVAHELNQPLNVIRMAAGNSRRKISKGIADPEYLNDKLKRIEEQTARAAAIIDHMRMFGREAKERPGPIDPRNVVMNALSLMGEQLRLAGIEIATELPEKCSFILGHTIQMEQVILNLLTNARDAMAENDREAKITLRVFENDKRIHIISEDTGGGIPEDILSRIFEPFYTTKEMGKGTGLGLSVSYGIVRDMHGTIIAKNITHGARFTITLPIVN
jgi:PAS domain S-box-containing protein